MKVPFEFILHGLSLVVRVAELIIGRKPTTKRKYPRKPRK